MRATLLLTILLVGTGSAAWNGPGTLEPDTRYDREPGRMFEDPDPTHGPGWGRVYLSGFATTEGLVVNPNAGLVGSRQDAPAVRYRALFGAWRDCNGDGYVGSAESALQEYRAEALALDSSACPPGSAHNDGQWVHELLAIGMVDPCEHKDAGHRQAYCEDVGGFVPNTFVLYSPGSAIWADLGAPGAAPEASCALAPLPRGTTASTGGLVRAADCRAGTPPAPVPDVAGPLSLFGDPGRDQTGLLQSGSGRPMARPTECGRSTPLEDPAGPGSVSLTDPSGGRLSGPIVIPLGRRTVFHDHDGDPATPGVLRVAYADDEGAIARVPGLDPDSGVDAGGSAWDAAVLAVDDVRVGASHNAPLVQKTTPGGPVVVVAYDSDCDPASRNTIEQAYVGDAVESDAASFSTGARARSDFVLRFDDGYRSWHASTDPLVGSSAPTDMGVLATRGIHQGPLWSATAPTTREPTTLRRGDVAADGARYVTFYADLGDLRAANPRLPTSAGGVYGQEACQGATSGIRGGWQCDATKWWRDGSGNDVRPRYAEGAPMARDVHAPYDLRDVDCFDGALAHGVPLYAGTAPLSQQGPCEE